LISSVIEACQQHGLPPFAADSLVREDAGWLGCMLCCNVTWRPSNRRSRALATLRSASAGQACVGVALVSGQYSMVPAALVPFLGAGLQAAWSHWLLAHRTCN
jgi:FdhE protein